MRNGGATISPGGLVQWAVSHRQFLLVLMFALLHLRLMEVFPGPYGRISLLMHWALFLLWQPFVSAQSRIGAQHLVWVAAGILIALVGVTWPVLAAWLIMLAGIVGGRVFFFSARKTKWFYLMALAYLILLLLFQAVPQILPEAVEGSALMSALARYCGVLLLGGMALLAESREEAAEHEAIDLAYSLFVILVLSVLVLGGISLMYVREIGYIGALLTAVFSGAIMLLAASWLWSPVAGLSRLGTMGSRYMMALGLPFEHWLRSLNELAEKEEEPERFLDCACNSMVEQLPWIRACSWSVDENAETKRQNCDGNIETVFRQGELNLILTTRQAISPVLVWHFNLVTQVVARFYVEKRSAVRLREMAYISAVHETGARVTHDVKNLLQSLHGLLFVVGGHGEELSPRAYPLLRRQLPLIAQRMQQTLNKLQAPEGIDSERAVSVKAWWLGMQARYEGHGIRFDLQGDADHEIQTGLFTAAAENLLQNALEKRAIQPDIEIAITLDMRDGQPVLSVRDSGLPLPDWLAKDVGRRPVPSENGLGIGLYQLARLADVNSYMLALSDNRQGEVVFSLKPSPAPASRPLAH